MSLARHIRRCACWAGLAGLLALAPACSNVAGENTLLPTTQARDVSAISGDPVLTAVTTRNPVKGAKADPWFGSERASASQVRVQLASPAESAFAPAGFGDWRLSAVKAIPVGRGLSRGSERRDVLIYVHGFNQTFETAALDAARLSDGISFRGATLLFSWPSRGRLTDYIYDRESAMWSRDAFESMLDSLIADPAVGKINIVAHSMGTMLTVEALRQIYDRRGSAAVGRFGAVVLAAPDIDIDGFSASINRIGPLTDKITVLTASTDRALDVMRQLAGGVTRVGAVDAKTLQSLGLRVIDATQVGVGALNHDLFLSNVKVRAQVRRVIEEAGGSTLAGTPPVASAPLDPAGPVPAQATDSASAQ
jgi:esterase/lipase superfamily enzyme